MPDYPVGPARSRDPEYPPGDALGAADVPPYPPEWDSEQRLSAYWYAHGRAIPIRSTESWHAVLADAQRTAKRHRINRTEEEL